MADEKKTHCRNHCRNCGGHFTSERAFSWHRVGKMSARGCMDPALDEKGRFTPHEGDCSLTLPDGAEPEPATVWSVR